ncbi:MAG: hypothetical protein D6805_08595 [Planctomycetota bacterium]|nr:MAG: hypothetical protein D6805_08595 [Planctomycetota bacterium]
MEMRGGEIAAFFGDLMVVRAGFIRAAGRKHSLEMALARSKETFTKRAWLKLSRKKVVGKDK